MTTKKKKINKSNKHTIVKPHFPAVSTANYQNFIINTAKLNTQLI